MWHSGKKFTAKDVNYTLQGAEFLALDDATLKVTLKEPYAPLLTVLSQPIFKEDLEGLGPYKVSNLIYDQEAISELTLVPQNRPMMPTLVYKFYRGIPEALLAFKMGEIDILKDLSDISDLKTWKNINILESTRYDRFLGVFFNLKSDLFKDKEIRQALAYGLPKFSDLEKTYSPISPLSWAYSQKIRLYSTDIDAATKILSKSELATPSSQFTISTFAPFLDTAEKIAESWSSAGVYVKVKVENTLPEDYQVAVLAQTIPADPDQYSFWQSTQEDINITHYSNQKIDQLLEVGRKTLDQDARKKIYADFQRYLVDDAPVLFLYYPKVYTVERK
jgi:peptide/nickel transport system substrate-binding protein